MCDVITLEHLSLPVSHPKGSRRGLTSGVGIVHFPRPQTPKVQPHTASSTPGLGTTIPPEMISTQADTFDPVATFHPPATASTNGFPYIASVSPQAYPDVTSAPELAYAYGPTPTSLYNIPPLTRMPTTNHYGAPSGTAFGSRAPPEKRTQANGAAGWMNY